MVLNSCSDYSHLLPYIVPHKKHDKLLFCTLTQRSMCHVECMLLTVHADLNKIPEEVEAHVKGKRYQQSLKLAKEQEEKERKKKEAREERKRKYLEGTWTSVLLLIHYWCCCNSKSKRGSRRVLGSGRRELGRWGGKWRYVLLAHTQITTLTSLYSLHLSSLSPSHPLQLAFLSNWPSSPSLSLYIIGKRTYVHT